MNKMLGANLVKKIIFNKYCFEDVTEVTHLAVYIF